MALNARAAWVLLDARPFLAFVLFICVLSLCVRVVCVRARMSKQPQESVQDALR
jgi:hypothetical protein